MKKKNVLWALVISLFGLGSLIFSINLEQKNPETIFLTSTLLKNYEKFKQDAPEKHILILKRNHHYANASELKDQRVIFYQELKNLEELCPLPCEVITAKKLERNGTNNKENQKNELMNLENDEGKAFSAAIFIDDQELFLKKILKWVNTDKYWNDSNVNFSGMSYTNFLLDQYSESIQKTLFPLMFTLGFVLTFFFINDLKESVIIYLPCLYMAGMSLFALKMIDGHMNMVTSIVPLVVFTISLSLSLHTFYSIKEFKSIKHFLQVKWKPIFLMIFTTYVGFLSLAIAEIGVIKKFGLLSSHLILLGVGGLFLWYKNFETLVAKNPNKGRVFLFEKIFYYSLPKWAIFSIFSFGIVGIFYFVPQLEIITDATRYFPRETKLRENIIEVTKMVTGMPVTEIVLDLDEELTRESLTKISGIEESLRQLDLSQSYQILSNNNLVKLVNAVYAGVEKIPENMPSYFAMRSQLPLSLQETYPIENYYRMTFMGSPLNVSEYKRDLEKIENVLKKSNYKYRINGLHHNLMMSQEAMINVLYESFLASALLVFTISAFYLRRPRLIIAFAIVNSVPVLLAFSFMYLMDYSINIATVMTFSIALGLLGDSTFHISHAMLFPFKSFSDYAAAVLSPVLLSGVLLFLCFVIFMFNSFHPIKEFGGILAFIILGGFVADLYMLPTLIYRQSNHRSAYEDQIQKGPN